MTWRETLRRRTTMTAVANARQQHAQRPARGWPAVLLRVAGAGLLIATAATHLDLYLTGYRTIPVIGWLFLLQVIAAFGLGLAVLAVPGRFTLAGRLAAAAGAGFALATLGGYLLSVAIGLFGFTEVRTTAGIVAGLIEVAAFAVLAALALIPARTDAAVRFPVNGAIPVQGALAVNGAGPRRAGFPARIPAAIARPAQVATAALTIAALVLFAIALAGAGPAGSAAADGGAGLKTAVIGGTTVLTNAKGFTLYSFAPDTPAASKCYGSCAVYWPRPRHRHGQPGAAGPGRHNHPKIGRA